MSEFTTTANLVPGIRQFALGAPDNLIYDALRRSLVRFFEKTKVLTEDIDIVTVVDQAGYTLTPATAGFVPHEISEVWTLNDDDEKCSQVDNDTYYFDMNTGKLVWEQGYVPATADLDYRVTVVLRMERVPESDPAIPSTETLTVTTVADNAECPLTPTSGSNEIYRINSVTGYAATEYYLDREAQSLMFETASIPAVSGTSLSVVVALKPMAVPNVCPAWIISRWGEKIASGALSEILMLPGRPWTNPELAVSRAMEFNDSLREAIRTGADKGVRRPIGLRP